jgi:hypothetical protein
VSSERSQSETVGVLLITGIVIILVGTLGVAMTSNVMSQMEGDPQIDLGGDATKENVTLEHVGGARLETSELEVVLQGDSTERYDLTSFTQRRGDDPTWFESGDRYQRGHNLSGDSVEVLLVHRPSNSVVSQTVLELRPTGPFFEVDITDTNSPVEQDEMLEVDVTVENTGIDTGTQDLEFTFDGTPEATESITLSEGQTTSRTFTYDTSGDDPDTYTVGGSTDNRTDEETVTVIEKQANITITAVEGLPDETTDHEYNPNVTVTESAGIQTDGLAVELILEERDNETAVFQETKIATENFSEINSESLTVGFLPGQLDENSYDYYVTASADNAVTDGASGGFVVGEPAFFNVTIDGTNSPINTGDILRVDATISNTGGITETQTIELTIDGTPTDSQSVTLGAGENETITLEWPTDNKDKGDHTASVSSNDDSDSIGVTVESGASQAPDVRTEPASNIDNSSATLNGDLRKLGTASEVEVFFEYRKTDATEWTETTRQTKTETGAFDRTISGLDSNADYEFHAVAKSESGRDEGANESFTTDSTTESFEYDIVSIETSTQGNNIDVTFEIDTTDPDAQVKVQSLEDGTILDETKFIDVADSQPQTERVKESQGPNQATDIRVILYDGGENEQTRMTVPYSS